MEGKRVLVVGDVMLDRYLWGEVSRISPEAPVPVVEVTEETYRLGGAANVADNVRGLGARPLLIGVVGEDTTEKLFREELEGKGLDGDGLYVDPARPTTLKTRIVARGQHVVRADQESREEIEGEIGERILEATLREMAGASVIVLSDYGKGVITAAFLEAVLPQARGQEIPVCVDPKGTHFNSYLGVAVITPNQHEAAEVLGFKLRDEDSVTRAGQVLLDRLQAEGVLITRGAEGMSLFLRGRGRTDFPVAARRVYDVTGAGDTVVGSYAAALAGGAEPREAALIATHAAGLVVAEVGTAVPEPGRIRESFGGRDE
jgi:D-beta-D-heptose 7-phosphate kinase/D-beta-D-heptose 1-phosphate adenosyltransferase